MITKPGQAAADALKELLSLKVNRDMLMVKYQQLFDRDPVATVERLLKLMPKAGRGVDTDPDEKKIGVEIILSDGGKKPRPPRRTAKGTRGHEGA